MGPSSWFTIRTTSTFEVVVDGTKAVTPVRVVVLLLVRCEVTTRRKVSVVRSTTGNDLPDLKPVVNGPELFEIQKLVRAMPVSDEVIRYAVQLVSKTRPDESDAPAYIKEFVRWGASPRASQYLILGAKARAASTGKLCADFEGVRHVARQVLRHRVLANFNARAQKVGIESILDRLLDEVKPSSR